MDSEWIYGTSKSSLNLDPINGQIWTRAPRIYHQNTSKSTRNLWEHPYKRLFLHIWTSKKCQIWKRRAPENDEDPSKNFLKILNMGPISI